MNEKRKKGNKKYEPKQFGPPKPISQRVQTPKSSVL